MLQIFNKSCIGYHHIKNNKPCQDFSISYKDNERAIICAADGHGGELYLRSQIGSHFACIAAINVFCSLTKGVISHLNEEEWQNKIKLHILCEYNRMIEEHLSSYSIRKSETTNLSEDQIDTLKVKPEKAYGTTLTGAMVFGKKLVVIGIGDSEVLGIQKGELVRLFDNSDDPAGNITYSLCQEDAFKYLRVGVYDFNDFDGVLLCTDGLSSPYQSYANFNESFVKPMMKKIILSKSLNHIDSFVEEIASKLGVGDDVSLAIMVDDNANIRRYR